MTGSARMVKASLTLRNGTNVQIEGSTGEVRELLEFYDGSHIPARGEGSRKQVQRRMSKHSPLSGENATAARKDAGPSNEVPDLANIVALVKDCDEAEGIEKRILDRSSQVDRTLLPLYAIHEYLGNNFGLTSGEISKITIQLGVPVSQSNVSKTLSGTAVRYVIADKVRVKGQHTRYKLSRRGVAYVKAVIASKPNEDAK